MKNFALLCALTVITAVSSAHTAPTNTADYSALTREFYSAQDRGDAKAAGKLLCAKAVIINPRGIIMSREQLLSRMVPREKQLKAKREWSELQITPLDDNLTQVSGTVSLHSATTIANSQSLVSVQWRTNVQNAKDTKDTPCITVSHRMISGDAAEAGFWDEAFVIGEGFNQAPNAFLVQVAKDLKPGRALDVGMGQGRNAVWLASKGWDVTGNDIAAEGMKIARAAAAAQNTKLNTVLASNADFDFGREHWDLIAIIYAGGREGEIKRAAEGLKHGGQLVLEGFYGLPEAGMPASGVTFDRSFLESEVKAAGLELIQLDAPAEGRTDWGPATMRPVRLLAKRR